jgi:cation diffusion facilitator CzcD-associated flavoprotein CzcO
MADVMTENTANTSGSTVPFDALIVGAGFAGLYQLIWLLWRCLLAWVIVGATDAGGHHGRGRV